MEKTVSISRKDAEIFAAYFENENPHHLVVAAVLAGKRLKESLDLKESPIESGSKPSGVGWGNLVFEDGIRSPGAMFQLENVQKILKYKLYLFKK